MTRFISTGNLEICTANLNGCDKAACDLITEPKDFFFVQEPPGSKVKAAKLNLRGYTSIIHDNNSRAALAVNAKLTRRVCCAQPLQPEFRPTCAITSLTPSTTS